MSDLEYFVYDDNRRRLTSPSVPNLLISLNRFYRVIRHLNPDLGSLD